MEKINGTMEQNKCRPAWKILIFNAVVVSRLLYGLETIPMTTAMDTKINAFQQRCLRRILKIDPAYYSRVRNVEVLAKANKVVSKLKRSEEDWVDQLISAW